MARNEGRSVSFRASCRACFVKNYLHTPHIQTHRTSFTTDALLCVGAIDVSKIPQSACLAVVGRKTKFDGGRFAAVTLKSRRHHPIVLLEEIG